MLLDARIDVHRQKRCEVSAVAMTVDGYLDINVELSDYFGWFADVQLPLVVLHEAHQVDASSFSAIATCTDELVCFFDQVQEIKHESLSTSAIWKVWADRDEVNETTRTRMSSTHRSGASRRKQDKIWHVVLAVHLFSLSASYKFGNVIPIVFLNIFSQQQGDGKVICSARGAGFAVESGIQKANYIDLGVFELGASHFRGRPRLSGGRCPARFICALYSLMPRECVRQAASVRRAMPSALASALCTISC